eukprot:2117119-Pleurochrysis_carterae.AAC.2
MSRICNMSYQERHPPTRFWRGSTSAPALSTGISCGLRRWPVARRGRRSWRRCSRRARPARSPCSPGHASGAARARRRGSSSARYSSAAASSPT